MAISLKSAMRAGLVSGKAASKWKKPAILHQTTHEPSKMAKFEHKGKDEGVSRGNKGAAPYDHVELAEHQKDRVSSMPSRKTGGAGFGAATRGSKSPQGGHVDASYYPGPKQIDQFPKGQHKHFPKGAGFDGRGHSSKTGNTAMKGPIPRSGGPYGGGGKGTQ